MGKTAAAGAQGSTDSAAGSQQQGTGQQNNQGTGQQAAGQGGQQAGTGQQGQTGSEGQQQQTESQTGAGSGQQQQKGQQSGQQGSTDAGSAKAPDKYTLTLPEGGRIDASDVLRLETMGRKNNWTNDDAQAALEEYDAQLASQSAAFLETAKADTDYGGDKLPDTQRLARLAIAKVRPEGHARRDSFLAFMNRGGAGNHIEVLSFLADLGKMMGEDTAQPGQQSGTGKKRAAEMTQEEAAGTLYDHPTSVALDQRQKAAR